MPSDRSLIHQLTLLSVRQLARLPAIPVPAGWRVQPIAPAEVAPDRAVGRRTWEDFLAGRVSAPTPAGQARPR